MTDATTLNELRALNACFIHNFVTRDVASHDAILHKEFINIWPTGQKWDRASYLKYWATAFDPDVIVYWDVRDENITVIGDVALVRSTNKAIRRRDGQEVTGMTVYTDTYLRENGTWKCIQAQIGPVAPEHYPSDDTIVSVYIKGELQKAAMSEDGKSRIRAAVTQYLDAWNEPDVSKRNVMLEQCWGEGAVYVDPTVELSGAAALNAHIAKVQAARPGATLEFMSGIDVHHNVVRFLWRLVRADGTRGDTSIDFGEVGPDGRLAKIVGFFGAAPAL